MAKRWLSNQIAFYRSPQSAVSITGTTPTLPFDREGTFDIGMTLECDHVVDGQAYSPDECPRCNGTGYYYDFSLDGKGRVVRLYGLPLLFEQIRKAFLTLRGENVFHEAYGTRLREFIGKTISEEDVVFEVESALGFIALNQQNQRAAGQSLADDEVLRELVSVEVVEKDPRSPEIRVTIRSKEISTVKVSLNGD